MPECRCDEIFIHFHYYYNISSPGRTAAHSISLYAIRYVVLFSNGNLCCMYI